MKVAADVFKDTIHNLHLGFKELSLAQECGFFKAFFFDHCGRYGRFYGVRARLTVIGIYLDRAIIPYLT